MTILKTPTPVFLFLLLNIPFLFGACSTLIGNIKPIDVKSTSYETNDLSESNRDWIPLKGEDPSTFDSAYQSQKTGSVISLNSACNKTKELISNRDLRGVSQELFLGISDVHSKVEKELNLRNAPALQTTLDGKMEHVDIRMQTIVVKKGDCIYDLVLISKPETFEQEQKVFSRFVSSFHFK